MHGVRVSSGRTIGYAIFYALFGSFFIATSLLEGVPVIYSIPDAAVAIVAALWSHRFADKRISFFKNASGVIYYKGGVVIYLIYIVGLVARLGVEFLVIGPSAFTFTPGVTLSPDGILGFTVTDLLLAFGIGLLIGRNVRVLRRFNLIQQGKESVSVAE